MIRSRTLLALVTALAPPADALPNEYRGPGRASGPLSSGPVGGASASAISGSVLYSNGSLATAATGGGPAGVAPISRLANPDTSFGATCNTSGFRVADRFTVPIGEVWRIAEASVFAYQTQPAPGGDTTSTLTGARLRVWNGAPDDAASNVLFGNLTTNRQTATSFSGVWRVGAGMPMNLQRPIFRSRMGGLGLTLGAGEYWLEYSLLGSSVSGPFCPPSSTVSVDNRSLSFDVAGNQWLPIVDGGSQRPLQLPFELEGSIIAESVFADSFED